MHPSVAKQFITRGIIREGTEVEIEHLVKGISSFCDTKKQSFFRVKTATACKETGLIFFKVVAENGDEFRVPCTQVIGVDGMAMCRAVATYFMTEDGQPVPQGRKRGRKRKDEIAAELKRLAEQSGD